SDDEGMKYKLDEVLEHEALLLGRKTYEGFAAAWPGRTDEAGFADKMNSMRKYVVSTTVSDPEWNNTSVISSEVDDQVRRLKAEEGGDILVAGSATLVRSLHQSGLVDEYRLMVFPVVLGSGLRLFPDDASDKVKLSLASSKAYGNGIILNTYTRAS
ncbi:MAG: dihydrofolate reductase family protein, partial [Actinomycetota bacterium]|nr:dihydrofolate reductase family protein [Actinomycetota bacterium]